MLSENCANNDGQTHRRILWKCSIVGMTEFEEKSRAKEDKASVITFKYPGKTLLKTYYPEKTSYMMCVKCTE